MPDLIFCQQLSKKAADTIIGRFRSLFRNSVPTPSALIKKPKEDVLGIGVSSRKYGYIRDLAGRINSKEIVLSVLDGADDSTIRSILTQVKGIGDWTVDMYLLFGLSRLDVLPMQDLAFRKSMSIVYGMNVDDTAAIQKIAKKWQPYRSVAAWYLYKNL